MLLLDTNVVSELRKVSSGRAHPNVVLWNETVDPAETFISAVVLHELEIGVRLVERHDAVAGDLERSGDPLVDSERLVRVAALHGIIQDDLAVSLGERLELATPLAKLLEQRSQTVPGRTGTARRLDAAALHDQHDAFLF